MKINVTRSSMPDFEEYCNEIKPLWESHWLTNMGPKHSELQKALCRYLNVEQIELLTNGHMALEMTLQAMNLQGEVITTPFTFASTTHAIVRNGLKPVFCDIDPQTFCLDASKIERLITEKTCAILPVHVYGNICDVESIQSIAKKYGLKVIYDAAHAFGETYNGTGIGNFGDASIFSFHATKVFNTIEGGAVCYQNQEVGKRLYDLKNFGIHGPESVTGIGANAKMNEFCAAMGLCNLRYIDEEILKRKALYQHYRERLENVSGIRLNPKQEGLEYNYAYFPAIFDGYQYDRDKICEKLAVLGIGARKYFYPLTNDFECYRGTAGFETEKTPVAKSIGEKVLTLPLYSDLEFETVDFICDVILR